MAPSSFNIATTNHHCHLRPLHGGERLWCGQFLRHSFTHGSNGAPEWCSTTVHCSGGSTQPHKSGTSLLYSWPGRAAYLRVCIKEVGNSRVPGSRPAQPLTLGAPGCSMATCRSLFITSDPQHFKQRPPEFLILEYSLLRNKREV